MNFVPTSATADAAQRLAQFELRTPLVRARSLARGDETAYLKCENLQRTGSFKIRGALNKVLSIEPAARERGVVTSSTGNHGAAVAEALRLAGGRGRVVVSSAASPYKVKRLAAMGVEVVTHDGDLVAAELAARAMAEREGLVYVSPYNDAEVVAGQGTVGVELLEQLPDLDAVYVAVGGGGLVAGIAAALRAGGSSARIVACWPERAPAMREAMHAGHVVDVPDLPTFSDGTAGNVEPGSITVPLCRELIDEEVLVSEEEIAAAVRETMFGEHLVIEGAAGVAVAAWRRQLQERPERARERSVIVLCGGNVSRERLAEMTA